MVTAHMEVGVYVLVYCAVNVDISLYVLTKAWRTAREGLCIVSLFSGTVLICS